MELQEVFNTLVSIAAHETMNHLILHARPSSGKQSAELQYKDFDLLFQD